MIAVKFADVEQANFNVGLQSVAQTVLKRDTPLTKGYFIINDLHI